MIHELKCVEPFFTDVVEGRKTFELRKNDRNFQDGDVLRLRKYDGKSYMQGDVLVDVISVCRNLEQYGLPNDMCIMSIKRTEAERHAEDDDDDEGYF